MKVYECDVAVIGAGISGMIAALRCAQGGMKSLVFEKTPDQRYICNSRLTGGIWHCCQTDILTDPAKLQQIIMTATGGNARPDLAKAVATDGIRVVRWMQQMGIRFMKGPFDYQSHMLAPPTLTLEGRQWEGRGGDVMLRTFESKLTGLGGSLQRGHRAVRLIRQGEAVTGFAGETADGGAFEVRAGHTVLADGGFQTNTEMTRGPITPDPNRVFQRNAKTGMGDGLKMAMEAGAAATDLRGFYGHVLSRDTFSNDRLWPYAWLDFVVAAGIGVRSNGRRFDDEGKGGVHMANAIAALDDPLDTFVIADQRIWDERGTYNFVAPNPRLPDWGGTMHKAASLAELAAKAGIDSAGLVLEVEAYNRAVVAGATDRLQPARSTGKFTPYAIEKAPFYAFPACAGITYTMGGVSIDDHCRVLAANGHPVAGLLAVGCTTGGLEGGDVKGYVGGLVKSSVTGLRAAEHVLGVLVA